MNWVFISVILLTFGQTFVCGFSLTMLISYIGRIVFLLRCIGSVVPYKVSLGFEAANLFFVLLGIIFSKSGVDWVGTSLTFLFCAVICLLYAIDDRFYLYVVVDDEDNKEDEG